MKGTVIDRFEIKGLTALEYGAAGLVVIFRHASDATPPNLDDAVVIARPDGWVYVGKAKDIRHESLVSSTGIFLSDLTADDVPIGAAVRWGDEILPLQMSINTAPVAV